MVKKPKTVAFRVTEEEYEALVLRVNELQQLTDQHIKSVAHLIEDIVQEPLINMVASLRKRKKNAEAAAKRAASKAAKQAANDTK
jgi:hypothetical protein